MKPFRVGFLLAVFVFMIGAPAAAHPQGPRPVAIIRAKASTVEMLWIAAKDDMEMLALRLENSPTPELLSNSQRFRDYILEKVSVVSDDDPCPSSLVGVGSVRTGYGVSIDFSCKNPPSVTSITISLLHDISPEYVTLVTVETEGPTVRSALRFGAETITVDFRGGTQPKSPPAETEPEGWTGRIISALEGRGAPVSLALALALAFLLGALHALTPGHGKTITAAYLVGEGGTMRQALYLGGVVTLTHALSVVVLGVLAISFDQILLPQQWEPWIEVTVGALIIAMGLMLIRPGVRRHYHHHHLNGSEDLMHHHHLDFELESDQGATRSLVGGSASMPLGRLAILGMVGGLIPSPEAIGIVLVAFSLDRWVAGVLLVVAFSLGLAGVVLAVALAAVRGGRIIRRLAEGGLVRAGPKILALVFLLMGVLVMVKGFTRL